MKRAMRPLYHHQASSYNNSLPHEFLYIPTVRELIVYTCFKMATDVHFDYKSEKVYQNWEKLIIFENEWNLQKIKVIG